MKHLLLILFIINLCSCKSYQHLAKTGIKDIYILYQLQKGASNVGKYELYDKSIVYWSNNNTKIKKALAEHVNDMEKLEKRPVEDFQSMIQNNINKKPITYRHIKVIPLREFGYLKMKDERVVYYGIMGDVLIDLSSNKVYH